MMRNLFSGILLTAAAVSMAAMPVMADEATTEEAETMPDLSGLGDVTLRFSWWGGDERNEATMQVIDQFEKLYPNITIEGEYGSSDGYHDKLATQLASGTAADIVQVDPETFPTFINVNPDYFLNLDDLDIDMSDFSEDYIHKQINGYYDGKQLGLPTGIAGGAILVNQDLADEIGVDLSKDNLTWEDWIEMGKKVHEYDDSMYLLCTNKEMIQQTIVNTYCKQLIGGTIYQDGKLALTQDQLTEVLNYVKELYDSNTVAPASYQASYVGDDIQSDANWIAGKYVAEICWISTVDVVVAANPTPNYTIGNLPVIADAKDGGWASNTPQVLAITSTCKYPEAAAAFLNYFFNNSEAQETLGATRSVPPTESARKIATENGKLTDIVSEAADKALEVNGTSNDGITGSEEFRTIMSDAVEQIGYGQGTPEDVAADTIDQLKDLEQTD